ncbi:MAG: methyltransferase domain-containing protein [Candidatus Handelsmanbacteria bacterium]|nr:methyltransferase domain-containing protein [Candidatus Handelsmanbacteria bacterium]
MSLPPQLQRAIEQEAGRFPPRELGQAALALSEAYRSGQPSALSLSSDLHRLAYAAARLPATFAALHRVLAELCRRWPGAGPRSLLDLGAGMGTSGWAAAEVFPGLAEATLVEADAGMIGLGQSLAGEHPLLAGATWVRGDLRALPALAPRDLVVCSYALGELGEEEVLAAARAAWVATRQALVLLEPGTMRGFGLVRRLRAALIGEGAQVVAPCPHRDACPLPAGDWCHFAARLERSRLQKRLKEGTVGYEDEKYTYAVLARSPGVPALARILRHPRRRAGHADLQLCTPEGLRSIVVTRSDKAAWTAVRKAEWGDEYPFSPPPG